MLNLKQTSHKIQVINVQILSQENYLERKEVIEETKLASFLVSSLKKN